MKPLLPVTVFTVFVLWALTTPGPALAQTDPNTTAAARTTPMIIKVGGYVFPPYVEEEQAVFRGLTLDFIELLNSFQPNYRFEFIPTSSLRRYKDFQAGAFDVMAFESLEWGWEGFDVAASRSLASDCEVYVAKAAPGRTQKFFDNPVELSKRVFLGYHYPFAGYNADPEALATKFNARATVSHAGNIRSVQENRADAAVVTLSYLIMFLRDQPALIPKCLISERIEQRYRHAILLRKSGRLRVEEMNAWIADMERAGYLEMLWGKYALNRPECREGYRLGRKSPATGTVQSPHPAKTIKVGGYVLSPYVEEYGGKYRGAVLDLVELLNSFQSEYRFDFVPTTLENRFKDLISGKFDVLFFQPKEWGALGKALKASPPFATDRQQWVFRAEDAKKGISIADLPETRVLEFPVARAPVVSDSEVKTTAPDVVPKPAASMEERIDAVLEKKADAVAVTKSFLHRYLQQVPSVIPLIHSASGLGMSFSHTMVTRADFKPSAEEISKLIGALQKAGFLSVVYDKYKLEAIPGRP